MAIGVDEVACFIDFGVDFDAVVESLPFLNELREKHQHFAPDSVEKSVCTTDETVSIPLTKAQRQLWFLTQLGDNSSAAYNESMILQLRGTLNFAAIQQAVQKVSIAMRLFGQKLLVQATFNKSSHHCRSMCQ
jgi:hypothetical protein